MSRVDEPGNPFNISVTPRQVDREVVRWVPTAVKAGAILIGIGLLFTFIMWRAGWWFTEQNAQRTAHVVQSNYNTQLGYVSKIQADVGAIDANIATAGSTPDAGMTAQNIHSGQDACNYASLLVPGEITLQQDMKTWMSVNCADGALAPTSNVYKGGNGE